MMYETELGLPWDIAFDSNKYPVVIYIDTGDDSITLTPEDLREMLAALGD